MSPPKVPPGSATSRREWDRESWTAGGVVRSLQPLGSHTLSAHRGRHLASGGPGTELASSSARSTVACARRRHAGWTRTGRGSSFCLRASRSGGERSRRLSRTRPWRKDLPHVVGTYVPIDSTESRGVVSRAAAHNGMAVPVNSRWPRRRLGGRSNCTLRRRRPRTTGQRGVEPSRSRAGGTALRPQSGQPRKRG